MHQLTDLDLLYPDLFFVLPKSNSETTNLSFQIRTKNVFRCFCVLFAVWVISGLKVREGSTEVRRGFFFGFFCFSVRRGFDSGRLDERKIAESKGLCDKLPGGVSVVV